MRALRTDRQPPLTLHLIPYRAARIPALSAAMGIIHKSGATPTSKAIGSPMASRKLPAASWSSKMCKGSRQFGESVHQVVAQTGEDTTATDEIAEDIAQRRAGPEELVDLLGG